MHKISEELLQFIWQHRLLKPVPLFTCAGHGIRVIKQGELNRDAGPDFFNGQVEISGLLLAGNIELHVKASDWLKHGHQHDRAYDHIILHVVYENDVQVRQNSDNGVEVLELREYIDEAVLERYRDLSAVKAAIPCHAQLASVSDLQFISWRDRMSVERLEQKHKKIEQLVFRCHGDYGQVMYQLLLSNFGFKVNALPMELLSRQLPLQLLLRHADNLLQVEALLFGTAGMLDEQLEDQYLRGMQNEYAFLRKKYKLQPLNKEIFKFSKLRPANFPDLRLAQFATLLHRQAFLFSNPLGLPDISGIKKKLMVELDPYWKHHYRRGGKVTERELGFGESAAENVIINTIAPFYFFYGKKFNKEEFQTLALDLLNGCKAEDNRKTRHFAAKKLLIDTAACSQAMIHLFDNYCEHKKCLNCGIGMAILNGAVKPAAAVGAE